MDKQDIQDLACGRSQDAMGPDATAKGRVWVGEPGAVEPIEALVGLVADGVEVEGDGGGGTRLGAELFELWVVAVAVRFAGLHLLGEQAFTPEGDESLRVEVAWV